MAALFGILQRSSKVVYAFMRHPEASEERTTRDLKALSIRSLLRRDDRTTKSSSFVIVTAPTSGIMILSNKRAASLFDSGLVHTLLRLDTHEQLLGHPIVGMSWEGHVIETLIRAAPDRCQASFYRTATGAEIDLILELPGNHHWAIEIKRGLAPKLEKGFYIACEDLKPDRTFVVYFGTDRYPKGEGIEVTGLRQLAEELTSYS